VSPALALRAKGTFRHGVHPEEFKERTAAMAIERMPFVDEYVLPLSQHTGAPSKPVVVEGDRVLRGQRIADADGFISTALHAPVTGRVKAIELRPHPSGKRMRSVVIEADPFSDQRLTPDLPRPDEAMSGAEIAQCVQQAGLVGLGGAAFPSHVKLQVPGGRTARFVILNGCECEPYLTCDHRVMVERAEPVLHGMRIIMQCLGVDRGYVGVELNKPDAIEALRRAAGDDPRIRVEGLKVKYPQGAEKMLIDAIFRKEVPSGKLPLDIEMVVNNVGTAAALSDLFRTGQPLIERAVTVTGPGVRRPANLMVPIGTPLAAVLDYCGGLHADTRQVILGGPMMGQAQKALDVPVLKGVSGVLAFTEPFPVRQEDPCIRCGRCVEACPMLLNPARLAQLARYERVDDLGPQHLMDCFECASCSFVCPSNIPLVQYMRLGKAMMRQRRV